MSALLRLQEKILETGALIERYERGAAKHPPTPAVFANLRTLVRQRERLERDFEELAHRLEVDVYHYRLLPQATERITLTAVSQSWRHFQTFFSTVYGAVKNGPRQTTKLGADERSETEFGFGYAYAGSVGVALTLPNERLLAGVETVLGLATQEAFGLARAQTSEEIASFARRLGHGPVRALLKWAEAHVANGLGAQIEWRHDREAGASLLIQYQELERLRNTILLTSDTKESTERIEGMLEGVEMKAKTFVLRPPVGDEIRGTFTDAISETRKVEIPARYKAVIRKTTKVQYAMDDEKTTHVLVSLDPL